MGDKVKKNIFVVASPDPQAPNGIGFELRDTDNKKLSKLVFDKSKEVKANNQPMKTEDVHEVHFHLKQDSGMTLEFAQHPDDALWVHWGDEDNYPPCPKSKPDTCPDPVFHACQSSPNLLKALNSNPEKRLFRFALNFVDPTSANPGKLIVYDPDGGNENGGADRFSFSSTMLAGAIAGAIGAAGAISIASNGFEPASPLLYAAGGGVVGLLVGLLLGRF